MAIFRPLVCYGTGEIGELPIGDTIAGTSGSFDITAYTIAFSLLDPVQSFSISDITVGSTSKIQIIAQKPQVSDMTDVGVIYDVNVVRQTSGSFDVVIRAQDYEGYDCVLNLSEYVTLLYTVEA